MGISLIIFMLLPCSPNKKSDNHDMSMFRVDQESSRGVLTPRARVFGKQAQIEEVQDATKATKKLLLSFINLLLLRREYHY